MSAPGAKVPVAAVGALCEKEKVDGAGMVPGAAGKVPPRCGGAAAAAVVWEEPRALKVPVAVAPLVALVVKGRGGAALEPKPPVVPPTLLLPPPRPAPAEKAAEGSGAKRGGGTVAGGAVVALVVLGPCPGCGCSAGGAEVGMAAEGGRAKGLEVVGAEENSAEVVEGSAAALEAAAAAAAECPAARAGGRGAALTPAAALEKLLAPGPGAGVARKEGAPPVGPPPAPPPAPALNVLAPLLGRKPTALKAPAALLPVPAAPDARGGGLPAADPGSAAKLGAPTPPRGWPAACGCHVGGASCALPAGPGAAPPLPPKEKGRAAKDVLLLLLLALGLKPVLLPKGAPASGGGAELEKGAG